MASVFDRTGFKNAGILEALINRQNRQIPKQILNKSLNSEKIVCNMFRILQWFYGRGERASEKLQAEGVKDARRLDAFIQLAMDFYDDKRNVNSVGLLRFLTSIHTVSGNNLGRWMKA